MKASQILQLIKTHSHSITMNADEKATMRDELLLMVETNSKLDGSDMQKPTPSPWLFRSNLFARAEAAFHIGVIAFAFLLIGGVGVVTASESSLPGDILYTIKVSINEEVRSFISSTPEQKIDWELERTKRRFNEATALAVQGKLNQDLSESIAQHIEEHTSNIFKESDKIAASNPNLERSVNQELESSLKAHSLVLAKLSTSDEAKENLQPIVQVAEDKAVLAQAQQEKAVATIKKTDSENQDENEKTNEEGIKQLALAEYSETGALLTTVREQLTAIKEGNIEQAVRPTRSSADQSETSTIVLDTLVQSTTTSDTPQVSDKQQLETPSQEIALLESDDIDMLLSEINEESSTAQATSEESQPDTDTLAENQPDSEEIAQTDAKADKTVSATSPPASEDQQATLDSLIDEYDERFQELVIEYDEARSLIDSDDHNQALEALDTLKQELTQLMITLGIQADIQGIQLELLPANINAFTKKRFRH